MRRAAPVFIERTGALPDQRDPGIAIGLGDRSLHRDRFVIQKSVMVILDGVYFTLLNELPYYIELINR